MLADAGFVDVCVDMKEESREFIKDWLPGSGAEDFVVAANVTAVKPKKYRIVGTVLAVLRALGRHHAAHTDWSVELVAAASPIHPADEGGC